MGIKKWIGEKWKLLKHSKFFLFVLGVVIGATYFYCYIAGTEYLNYATIGYRYSTEFLNRAEASETRQDMGSSVPADGHLDEISHEGRVTSPEALIKKYFPENYEQMTKIAECESHFNPQAVGDGHIKFEKDGQEYGESIGIFQIRLLKGRPTREQLMDTEFNISYAKQVFDRQGYLGWENCAKIKGIIK